MDRLVTPAPEGTSGFTCPVPSGKSETLRALAIRALRGPGAVLAHPPLGDDVRDFIAALGHLGVEVAPASDRIAVLRSIDREIREPVAIRIGEGGAPARFVLALAATTARPVTLSGGPRLSVRPFAALCDALRALGAEVSG